MKRNGETKRNSYRTAWIPALPVSVLLNKIMNCLMRFFMNLEWKRYLFFGHRLRKLTFRRHRPRQKKNSRPDIGKAVITLQNTS